MYHHGGLIWTIEFVLIEVKCNTSFIQSVFQERFHYTTHHRDTHAYTTYRTLLHSTHMLLHRTGDTHTKYKGHCYIEH